MRTARSLLLIAVLLGCGAETSRQPNAARGESATSEGADELAGDPSLDPCAVDLPATITIAPELEERAREFLDVECQRVEAGAWRLVFQTLEERPQSAETLEDDEHAPALIDGTWTLAYTDVDGHVALSEPQPLHIDNSQFYDVSRFAVIARFDFDGDGHAELAARVGSAQYEAAPTGALEIFTFSDGRVQRYQPAAVPFATEDVRDVDGDGRPDLVSNQPYFVMSPFGLNDEPVGGPLHVYRSLSDGSFSDMDEGALGLLRAACPEPPARILPPDGSLQSAYERGGLAVSCARIWGRSSAAIIEMIRAELPSACRDEGPHYTCEELASRLTEHARSLESSQRLR